MICRIALPMIVACLAVAPAARAGLVGYWSFDADDAADLSGSANHGTLVNSPGFSTDIPSTPGNVKSLDLTGAGDHVRVPHSASLSMADALTVAYWVKGGGQSAWIRAISKSDGVSGWEHYRTSSNQIDVRMDTSGAANQNLGGGDLYVKDDLADGTWHHVAITADNGLSTTYLDGTPLPSISYSHGDGFANVHDIAIGSTSQTFGYGNYDLNGLVDEVVIYDESLVPNQIAHIAGGGDPANLPAPPATVAGRLGTWSYEGYGGAIGFMSGLLTERATQMGLQFNGESRIDSFTIDQHDGGARHRIKDITVYASPTESYNFQLADDRGPQTFSLPNVETSYLLMTIDSRYTDGSSDFNMGIDALSVTGVEISQDVNLNAGIVPTIVGGLGGWTFPERATDGVVHDGGTSHVNNDTSTYFHRDAGQDSLTVTYAGPTAITMIGLGLDPQLQAGGGMRDMPKFVTLEYDGGSQRVDLVGDRFQYARYLLNTPIVGTSFLRVVFPDGGNTGDWHIFQNSDYGVTEFQAFYVIPEPSAFLLAALGMVGLAFGRRRRRR